jgi:uncharacterized protein (TIGR00730 family)
MRVCVFCGSSDGKKAYRGVATSLGSAIVKAGFGMVYGGGRVGLMGAVADAVLAAGGEAIGVMPRALIQKEVAHRSLTELHVVQSMHERKAMMSDLTDLGFIALPGGLGTLEELFEVWTWGQLGYHNKPVALLNCGGFFDPLLKFLDHATAEGMIRETYRKMLLVEDEPSRLLERMRAYDPPAVLPWVEAAERL